MSGISWPMVGLVLFLAATLLMVQPLLLGLSASMAGEKAPGWFKGMLTLIVAGLGSAVAGLVYSVTLGLVLSRLGTIPAAIGGLSVSWLATSVVYSALLRIAIDRAAVVAAIYWLCSGALASAIWFSLKLFVG